MQRRVASAAGAFFLAPVFALLQTQTEYTGADATGSVVLTARINVMQQAQSSSAANAGGSAPIQPGPTFRRNRLPPPVIRTDSAAFAPPVQAMDVSIGALVFGFSGLTHRDQRLANGGNQFDLEPPSQGLAAGNGYVVEAVNDAFQVYSASGTPLLPQPIATNQLFGLPPAINRATGVFGVTLTDPRVYFDPDTSRWFVVQWAQLNDPAGLRLDQPREYIAVSQTGDPTGSYFIYTIDTTHAGNFGCPCVPDYPQVGLTSTGSTSAPMSSLQGTICSWMPPFWLSRRPLWSPARTRRRLFISQFRSLP